MYRIPDALPLCYAAAQLSINVIQEPMFRLAYIPNFLTILRIAAVPVLIVLLKEQSYAVALILFIAAGITDGVDGYIAKRYGFESQLGAVLDPLADKMLLLSTFIMLTLLGHLPFWLLVTIVFRDLLIVGGCLVLVVLNGTVSMRPSRISKINTVMQICLVASILIQQGGIFELGLLVPVIMALVVITTILSGANYVWIWGLSDQPKTNT